MPFQIKPISNIINDILFNITQNVPDVNDLNPGSILRQMVEALSTEVEALYAELNNVYLGTRVETATTSDLDNLGSLVGITRKAGTMSSGNITFIRQQTASINFTIPADAIVSTQPNTGEEQLRFIVDVNTVFFAEITAESQKYTDGVIDYRLDERFIGSISSMTGLASTAIILWL